METAIIKANNVTKMYKLYAEEIAAVNKVTIEIQRGEFVAIMGPSGSGKTTLLDIFGCLLGVNGGTLKVFGHNVSHIKESKLVAIRRGNIGFIFQDFLLIPTLTALENMVLPLHFARKDYAKQRLLKLLEKVGLGQRADHLPKQLSGGERQRVAIARALAINPKLLIADEPTGNLDTKSAQGIFDLFKRLNHDEGITIIVATHNPTLGNQAKRIIYLKDGKVVSRHESSLYE